MRGLSSTELTPTNGQANRAESAKPNQTMNAIRSFELVVSCGEIAVISSRNLGKLALINYAQRVIMLKVIIFFYPKFIIYVGRLGDTIYRSIASFIFII